MTEATLDVWLSVPRAIFYMLTGDLARTRQFRGDDPHFLEFLVVRAVSSKSICVPLDPSATEDERTEAWRTLREKLAVETTDTQIYNVALKALGEILADGSVRTKGSRSPDGPIELIDPAEFTRVRLANVHAINEITKKIVWYDLRVSARDLLAFRQSVRAAGAVNPTETPHEIIEHNGPTRPRSRQLPQWRKARDAAMEWLADNGCPVPGDGNQAELERYIATWLDEHGYKGAEATRRRYATAWIKERRGQLRLEA